MADTPKKVLFVDDDAAMQELYEEVLKSGGFEVAIANNGAECLDIVRDIKPDLIIMDVMMPGMNGIETAAMLGKDVMTAKIPILFATNSISEGQEKLGGRRPFLSKCTAPNDFLAKVKSFVDNPLPGVRMKPIMDFGENAK